MAPRLSCKITMAALKTVQEMVIEGNEPPKRYMYNGFIGSSFPVLDVPEIDIALLQSSSPAGEEELRKLQSALSSCGCFQALNHGLTNSFLDKVRGISKQFFALPTEEKQKYSRSTAIDDTEGYGNDSILSENHTLDWTDRLFLVVCPEDQKKLQLWPQNPESFRETLDEYIKKLTLLNEIILTAMATSLKLDKNCFLDQYGKHPSIIARFNFYPPCPRPDLVLGVKPHADASTMTYLLQDDEVEGLQVLKDDGWYRVPIVPNAILVNVGDQSEIMSNGIFKSPVHRVITNSLRERNTLAVFCMPGSDEEIGPAEDLINEQKPRLYKNVRDYVDIYFQNYQQGKRPIEAAKV